jgi:uncharacterized C2H2 Zn-finger protein
MKCPKCNKIVIDAAQFIHHYYFSHDKEDLEEDDKK